MDDLRPRLEALRQLTARERQVLGRRARGDSVREIAAALVVEPRTVKFHLGNIYAKLGIEQRSQGARQLALARYSRALAYLLDEAAGGPITPMSQHRPPLLPTTATPRTSSAAATPPSKRGPGLPVPFEPVLTAAMCRPGAQDIGDYLRRGGYAALRTAVRGMTPTAVIDTVVQSKLVGRGGAGYPTGLKWSGAARAPAPRYLVVNADESEPGTFGNRYAIDADPHMLLEGMLLCCFAVGIETAHIYIRGENLRGYEVLTRAVAQAYQQGLLGAAVAGKRGFDVDVYVSRGAGAYICGEETALMESLEGRRPQPRIRPPFPSEPGGGLFGRPTVVNNVETLMCLPPIIGRGPEWFASIGTPACPGPKLYCVSGHVNRPGIYELPMGVTLRDLIYTYAGGMQRGQRVKAVSPGALACQLLSGEDLDVHLDTATLGAPPYVTEMGPVGFGAGGIVVYGEEVDMVQLLARIAAFFSGESCGKCVPCREGTQWMADTLRRIATGRGTTKDLTVLEDVAANVGGRKSLCNLGDFAANPVWSGLRLFHGEFERYVTQGRPIRSGAAA